MMPITSLLWAALGLTGSTQILASRREARAAKLQPPRGRDVAVDGTRIHVEVLGDGPDLVLIHGSSGNTRDFTGAFAPALATRYRVFVVDRPGLGWSDPRPDAVHLEVQARLIQSAVAELGAARPLVLGHSFGGAVALAWAATRPGTLSAVVSLSGVAYPWNTGLGLYYTAISSAAGRALLIPLITAFTPRALFRAEVAKTFAPQPAPPGYAVHLGPELTLRRSQLRANALQRRALLAEIEALSPQWAALDLPIELVHGDADPIVSHEIHAIRLAAENANATATILPGIGHMPHHVAPEAVIAAIDRAALRANVK